MKEPSLEDAYRQADAVVTMIDAAESARVPADRYTNVLTAMAAVSRCRSLLLGIVGLDKAGRADLVGVLLRAELEVWYFGVIALLGDEADIERLEADHRHWKNELAKALPGVDIEAGTQEAFSVHRRAMRTDELLPQVDEPSGNAVEWYRTIYAAESLTGTHAGFESLKRTCSRTQGGRSASSTNPRSTSGSGMVACASQPFSQRSSRSGPGTERASTQPHSTRSVASATKSKGSALLAWLRPGLA